MIECFQERHVTLIREFNEYLFEHPEFAEQIPVGRVSTQGNWHVGIPKAQTWR